MEDESLLLKEEKKKPSNNIINIIALVELSIVNYR